MRSQQEPQDAQDTRMSPQRWWLMTLLMALAFGVFCVLTRSWTPLADGWPLIVVVFLLAVIRQGADIYERYERYERRYGRRHAPHA